MYGTEMVTVKAPGLFGNEHVSVEFTLDSDKNVCLSDVHLGNYVLDAAYLANWVVERLTTAVEIELAAESAEKAA